MIHIGYIAQFVVVKEKRILQHRKSKPSIVRLFSIHFLAAMKLTAIRFPFLLPTTTLDLDLDLDPS